LFSTPTFLIALRKQVAPCGIANQIPRPRLVSRQIARHRSGPRFQEGLIQNRREVLIEAGSGVAKETEQQGTWGGAGSIDQPVSLPLRMDGAPQPGNSNSRGNPATARVSPISLKRPSRVPFRLLTSSVLGICSTAYANSRFFCQLGANHFPLEKKPQPTDDCPAGYPVPI